VNLGLLELLLDLQVLMDLPLLELQHVLSLLGLLLVLMDLQFLVNLELLELL
jgi:hypothetical protein